MKYYIGIDLGGTFIKGAVVSDSGEMLASDKIPTERALGPEKVIANIAGLSEKLLTLSGKTKADIVGIGIGVPGMIDGKRGVVVYSANFGWRNSNITEPLEKLTGLPVRITNDANAAALGETKFGVAKKYKNTLLLTLGTGVGGGAVIDGKLFEGNQGAGAEFGHSVIEFGGEPCACGRRGCLEAYASASALIRNTKRAMEADKSSKLWQIGSIDKVSGKTAFDFYDVDESARRVVDSYIEKLACGIINFANTLRPEAVILGGGVCAQGENLTRPLRKILEREIYAGKTGPEVELLIAELENNAGSLGAAALFMD
jgi:glucokinase